MFHLINIKAISDTFHTHQISKLKYLIKSNMGQNIRKWEHTCGLKPMLLIIALLEILGKCGNT